MTGDELFPRLNRRLDADEIDLIAARVGADPMRGAKGAPSGAGRTQTGPGPTQQAMDADPLLRALDLLGLVQAGPRPSPMGMAYDIECPWAGEHTDRATSGTVYVPVRTKFRCHHGHCDKRTHEHLRERVDQMLREESGGLTGLVHLEFNQVDPKTVPVSPLGKALPVTVEEARFLADTVYVGSGGRQKFWSVSRRVRLDDDGLNTRWQEELRDILPPKVTPARLYRTHGGRRDVDGYVSWPGGGALVSRHGQTLVNTWTAPASLTPVTTGVTDQDVAPWLVLVHHVLGSTTLEEAGALEHTLDWMAMVVGSWIKPGWHILITGKQGLGKDVIILPIVRALGAMATEIAGSAITGRFNAWAQARLVQVNEMRQTTRATSTAHDQMNVLKLWDNSRETVRIDEKGAPVFEARNVFAMWLTSNEDVPIKLDPNDRRFVVFNRQEIPIRRDLLDRYLSWMDIGAPTGSQLVHAWLDQRWRNMPAVRVDALKGRAFMTAAKGAMIDASMDENEVWLRRVIDAQPPSSLAIPDVVSAEMLVTKMGLSRENKQTVCSSRQMGNLLSKVGAERLNGGVQIRVDGERVRLWAVRNVGKYDKMSPTALIVVIQQSQQSTGMGGVMHYTTR